MSLLDEPHTEIVPQTLHGIRIDVVAKALFLHYSRAQIQEFIEQQKLLYNGNPIKKRMLASQGDSISLLLESSFDQTHLVPQPMDFSVIYEDEELFVIDKPPGLIVHPGAGNRDGTFVNGFVHRFPFVEEGELDSIRPGIVHRLDKDTSGVLIAAKNRRALAFLSEQFQQRAVQKEYIAFTHGRVDFTEKTVETQIDRDKKNRTKMRVVEEGGRVAISHISLIELFPNGSKLLVDITTGRTHQIRVHLEHLGYPVIGDDLYSNRAKRGNFSNSMRQMLHCSKIVITHPTRKTKCTFIAKLPQDMVECEALLR